MKEKVAQWRRWEIRVEYVWWKKIATKKALDDSKVGSLSKEVDILWYLSRSWITFVPDLISSWPGWFSYMRIEGTHFIDVYTTVKKQQNRLDLQALVLFLRERAYELDSVGVVHGELIRPFKNVLVTREWLESQKNQKSEKPQKSQKTTGIDENPVSILDFERGKMGDYSWKNMRSLSQRLLAEWWLELEVVKDLGQLDMESIYKRVTDLLMTYNTEKIYTGWETTFESNWADTHRWNTTNESLFLDDQNDIYGDHDLSETINVLNGMSLIHIVFFPFFLLAIDQITKILYVDNEMSISSPWIQPSFNTWIAWSLPVPMSIIIWLSLLFIVWIIWYYIDASKSVRNDESGRSYYHFLLCEYGVLLLLWWALGNLIDRVLLDGVRDFIDISPALPFDRPIFNLADVFVVMWVLFIFLFEFQGTDIQEE